MAEPLDARQRLLLAITPEDAARQPQVARDWIAGLAKGVEHLSEPTPVHRVRCLIQLRDKEADDSQLARLLDVLRRTFPTFEILLNGSTARATRLGFDGHHRPAAVSTVVERRSEATGEESSRPRPTQLVGQSTHSLDEARRAFDLGVDYLLFGPVFDTPSKRRYGPPRGLERLRQVCHALPIPILAVGGIDGTTSREALSHGAAGVAAIRAAGEPREVRRMIEALIEHPPEEAVGPPG